MGMRRVAAMAMGFIAYVDWHDDEASMADASLGDDIVRRHLGVRNRVQQNQVFRLSHDI